MNTAQPPRKKARTGANGDADEGDAPTFFLDAIPVDVLDSVLRFFSRLPEAEDCVPHIPVESIIELYGVIGELGTHMKPRFKTICISDSFKSESENQVCKWKERKGDILWTKDLNVARRFVLGGGG